MRSSYIRLPAGVKVTSVISIIIPTFNGASRIGHCLDSLISQTCGLDAEILLIDDGSTDNIAEVVGRYPQVRLIQQSNAGPASARNRGAYEARGSILLFTDDDCVPEPNWLEAMLEPFSDPEVVGAKGVYRTHQEKLVARFVQVEYEDRYHLMLKHKTIDFVDTYSAAFLRDKFLELGGYDTSFPVACAEDIELSYRMSARGWKMKFVPSAIVYHTHPDTLIWYLKKKYKFAFWRVLAVRKNPGKGLKDSHTPQIMKLQLLFGPVLIGAIAIDFIRRPHIPITAMVLAAFVLSTVPFTTLAFRKDPGIAMLSPVLLAARSCAQIAGIMGGLLNARCRPCVVSEKSAAPRRTV